MNRTADGISEITEEYKNKSAVVHFFKRLVKEKPLGTVGGVIVLLMLLTGIFADLIAPYPYDEVHPVDRLTAPNAEYILGTDGIGRDMLSRIIYGARISVIVGLSATALSTIISTTIGVFSGYLGGKFDLIVQRFVDAWMCFPGLVIYLLLMSIMGSGMLQIILVLGVGYGISGSRSSRSLAFWIKESAYIDAARSIGSSTPRILLRHLLPNIVPMVIVSFTMGIGSVILTEASLSFLGFGVPPPHPSWGQMISGQSRAHLERAPWMPLWPGVALTLVVYGVNMFGDAVRDLLDPRLRGGVGGMGGYGMSKASKALEKKKSRDKRTKWTAHLK